MLKTAAAAPFLRELAFGAQTIHSSSPGKLGIPGLFPGKVIGVEDQRSIASGKYNAEVINAMMRRGMKELTSADDWAGAWKLFFEKGTLSASK